jgi:bifunctional DNA-binding transcriptional regulator/antitoxin component of YhaV-PrlF toxin-antitoxin module
MTRSFAARIGTAGQLTVPAEIRRHLGLEVSDRVGFEIGDDGSVWMWKAPSLKDIESLRGIAGTLPRPMSWEEIEEIVEEERAEAFMRKRSRER